MKIALLSGADPRSCSVGPTVRLQAGQWRFHVHGLEDSVLAMNVEGACYMNGLQDHMEGNFPRAAEINLTFSKRGRERYITVIAEKIYATDDSAIAG